ncbi:hypothetical protein ACFQW6_03530 [Nocardioides sp. GCM10028917]|uniref:hypothetical protein n=1 Tax=Nocardioides sp. GCM10028917 TaxID=3273408 RepID=UPI003619D0E9
MGVIAILLVTLGCSDAGAPDGPAPPSPEVVAGSSDSAAHGRSSVPWPIAPARIDRISSKPPRADSKLPNAFPPDDSVLPDLLAESPGRALMAYHPRESFDDRGAWEAETVFFLGLDGEWRSLKMQSLGLPASTHPGVDTYGAGELSPDGTTWAAPTTAGIVLLDLLTVRPREVALPGDHTRYLRWRPDGSRTNVMRLHGASTQKTWALDPQTEKFRRASYVLPIDGFAANGSVVTFTRRGDKTVRTVHRDQAKLRTVVALPHLLARRGAAVGRDHAVFGYNRELVAVEMRSWAPVARLRLGRGEAAGWPRGWLDDDTLWFYESTRGLITWNVDDGQTRALTRVAPAARPDTYWSASVAVDLLR